MVVTYAPTQTQSGPADGDTTVWTYANDWRRRYNDGWMHAGDAGALNADSDGSGGGTDDAATINAAIVAAAGRPVYVPAGTYRMSSELDIADDGASLIGAGPGDRTNTGSGVTEFVYDSNVRALQVASGAYNVSVENILFRSVDNKTGGNGTTDGVYWEGGGGQMHNCQIWGFNQHNLRLVGHFFRGSHIFVRRAGGIGLYFNGANTCLIEHLNVLDNDIGVDFSSGYNTLLLPTFDADDTHFIEFNNGHNNVVGYYFEYSGAPATPIQFNSVVNGLLIEAVADATGVTNLEVPPDGFAGIIRGTMFARAMVPSDTVNDFTATATTGSGTTWTDVTDISQTVRAGAQGRFLIHWGGLLSTSNASFQAQLSPVVTETSEGDIFAVNANRSLKTQSTTGVNVGGTILVTGATPYTNHTIKLQIRSGNAAANPTVDNPELTVIPG